MVTIRAKLETAAAEWVDAHAREDAEIRDDAQVSVGAARERELPLRGVDAPQTVVVEPKPQPQFEAATTNRARHGLNATAPTEKLGVAHGALRVARLPAGIENERSFERTRPQTLAGAQHQAAHRLVRDPEPL